MLLSTIDGTLRPQDVTKDARLILRKYYPLLLLLLLGFIWGSGYTLARFVVSSGVPPLAYSFWQGAGPVLLFMIYMQLRRTPYRFNWKHIVTGGLGIALPNTNMYVAAQVTPAGILAVLVNTVPIFTYLFACMLGLNRFNWRQSLAVTLGIAGILCIINPTFSFENFSGYDLSVLITPISFACSALFIDKYCADEDNVNLACGMLLIATVLITPLMLWHQETYTPHSPFTTQDWAILLEIVLSTIGYVIFFELLKVANAVYYSFVGGIVVMTGLFWGYTILGESLHIYQTVGTIIVIIAIILINLKQGKHG